MLQSVGNNKVDPELLYSRSQLHSVDQSSDQFASIGNKVFAKFSAIARVMTQTHSLNSLILETSVLNFSDDLFKTIRDHRCQTRSQKQAARYDHAVTNATSAKLSNPLPISKEELIKYHAEDPTLEAVRGTATGQKNTTVGEGVLYQDGLLYRWKEGNIRDTFDQLVIPTHCNPTIMHLAHKVPLGGH